MGIMIGPETKQQTLARWNRSFHTLTNVRDFYSASQLERIEQIAREREEYNVLRAVDRFEGI